MIWYYFWFSDFFGGVWLRRDDVGINVWIDLLEFAAKVNCACDD